MTFVQKDLTRLGDTKFQVRPRDKDLSHNSSVVNSILTRQANAQS